MDPATALGVAAAAVQFIEVGLKTLALCKQIRDSDTDSTVLHAELLQATKQLESLQKAVTLDVFPRDTSRAIKQCSQDCSSAAKELQDLLTEIRAIAQKKRFGAARAAFRAMKDQKKVEKLQNRLEKCQSRFQTAVSVDTREQVLVLLQGQGKISQTLEDVVFPELKQMHETTHGQIAAVQKSSRAYHETTHKALANLKMASKASQKSIECMDAKVKTGFDHAQASSDHQAFLRSLEFPEMFSRHRHIDQPAPGTFEWIFKRTSGQVAPDPKTLELQGRFDKWLRSSEPVFWVNGKAGSGKSSLMSFIESHETTNDLLNIWAGGRKLHVFSFFFWRAGSEMQKSIIGLLQTLLYQLARAKPVIISDLKLNVQSSHAFPWTEKRLQHTVEQALSLFSDDRIFLLIDGLDEFQGKYTALVTLLLGLQDKSSAKMCLSSRPETALSRQLGSFPSLRLQNLNYRDIEYFVREELTACAHVFKDDTDFRLLIGDVAERAEGVFLWAVLVCKSLVSGYEARDDEKMIKRRLAAVPAGLEELFAHMFSNIEREHREYLTRCFFLLKWSKQASQSVTLPLITAFVSEDSYSSLEDFREACDIVKHRVVAQGKGLLELREVEGLDASTNIYLRQFGLCVLKDMSSGKPYYQSVRLSNSGILLELESLSLGWVHRSAYDCILGDSSDVKDSWTDSMDEDKLLRDLLNAKLWLSCYYPAQHMSCYNGPVQQIASLVEIHGDTMRQEIYQALDELHDTIQASYYGRPCADMERSKFAKSKNHHIYKEARPLRTFWLVVTSRGLGDYMLTRFDKIKSSEYVDILCSGFLYFRSLVGLDTKILMPSLTLSLVHLLADGPMGHSNIAACLSEEDLEWDERSRFCCSWIGNGKSSERRIVSDVLRIVWSLGVGSFYLGHKVAAEPRNGFPLDEAGFQRELFRLSDLWQIHWGRGLAPQDKAYRPLSIQVPAYITAWDVEVQWAPELGSVADESILNWRFICFDHKQDCVRQYSSGDHLSISACFDVRNHLSHKLMRRYGWIEKNKASVGFVGTPENQAQCLQAILEEVWADTEGQFRDGWQQLYMLACLKKHFGAFWVADEEAWVEYCRHD
jgi:hypothetical protein